MQLTKDQKFVYDICCKFEHIKFSRGDVLSEIKLDERNPLFDKIVVNSLTELVDKQYLTIHNNYYYGLKTYYYGLKTPEEIVNSKLREC